MSGDYSRRRFDPKRHYQGVLKQQGRVDLDADWNEYVDLQERRWRAGTGDAVGRCGVPMATPDGFKIQISAGQLTIGQGRIYVDGLLAENHGAELSFQANLEETYGAKSILSADQPYGPGAVTVPNGVRALVYLDVWRREVTHLLDPALIEPAVNVDTTTRYQNAWQVKLLGNIATTVTCKTPLTEVPNWPSANLPSAARLSTGTVAVTTEPDPCLVPPSGGYRGLENHLYRVEVHSVGGPRAARVKWSRENAHVATQIIEILPGRAGIRVESLGRDDVLRFKTGDWVEITSDARELGGSPGEMRKVTVDDANRTLTFAAALPAADFPEGATAATNHFRVIRWDQFGIVRKPDGSELVNLDLTTDGLIPLNPANPSFVLEHGIQVTLNIPVGGSARSGDYWNFAARTAEADIEKLDQAPPAGVHHHYCKLAIIEPNGDVGDCRALFPPLTELISLFYVSGDGQETLPGQALPKPIQVGVARGQWPVANARVNFHVTGGSGNLTSGTLGGTDITLLTDAQGIASCGWTLDTTELSQQVEARLADGIHLPVRFNAALSQPAGLEPGIHIQKIEVNNAPLRNDVDVNVTQLLNGISIECDRNLFQGSVRDKPVCFLSLEMPFPFNSADMQLWGAPVIGFQPLILAADVNSDNQTIFWRPSRETGAWLQSRLFQMMTELRRGSRVLARLTLKGNFIWDQQNPDLYLDGEVFGARTAGNNNTDIKLPSGDGRRGGDFEMWFWLVPPPTPTLTIPTATATIVTQPTLTATIVTQPTFTLPTATIITQPTLTLPTATIVTQPTRTLPTATIVTQPTIIRTQPTATLPTIFGLSGATPSAGGENLAAPTVIVPPRTEAGGRRRGQNPLAQVRGIKAAEARKLIAAGIDNPSALANAAPREVMNALGLRSQARARALIAEAKRMSEAP
jgi:hypothetical protein